MSFLATLKSIFGLGPKTANFAAGDRMLPCLDCRKEFVFDVGEQTFFKSKGFSDPKRCPRCRKKVRFRLRKRNRHHSNNHHHHGGGRHRRHSIIDGDSPYADER